MESANKDTTNIHIGVADDGVVSDDNNENILDLSKNTENSNSSVKSFADDLIRNPYVSQQSRIASLDEAQMEDNSISNTEDNSQESQTFQVTDNIKDNTSILVDKFQEIEKDDSDTEMMIGPSLNPNNTNDNLHEKSSNCKYEAEEEFLSYQPDRKEIRTDETEYDLQDSCSSSKLEKEILFRLGFAKEPHFMKLKNIIMENLSNCLKHEGIIVDFIENAKYLEICAMTKQGEDTQKNQESENLLFTFDTKPSEGIDFCSIPSYKRSTKDVLEVNTLNNKKNEDDQKFVARKTGNVCFNCAGNHSLRECIEPKNQARINRNRRQFMGQKVERYHIDVEQRFAHLKPGKLSKHLKRALGLRRREIPSFFYKMRVLGYPPGWLEDAKVAHSGIVLFDSEGKEVLDSDEEEGEIDCSKHKYDISKVISFPGFNVDPGPDYIDEYRLYNVPPLQAKDGKELFIKSLGDNIVKGYKRKKLKNLTATSPSDDCTPEENPYPVDMEIEDTEERFSINVDCHQAPPLPEEELPPLPPSPESYNDAGSLKTPINMNIKHLGNEENKIRNSPSLEDLEAKKRQLLTDLDSTSLCDTSQEEYIVDEDTHTDISNNKSAISLHDNFNCVKAINNDNNDLEKSLNTSNLNITKDDNISNKTNNKDSCKMENILTTPVQTRSSGTKSSTLGTPVLKFSPYDKLPSGESFKRGVSDVINFENLPDSTGKYEQMKKVIKKVRTIVTKLNEEN